MANVRTAAITSKEFPSIQLSGSIGSYSQIAVVVSTLAILVIIVITSVIPKLMTCAEATLGQTTQGITHAITLRGRKE